MASLCCVWTPELVGNKADQVVVSSHVARKMPEKSLPTNDKKTCWLDQREVRKQAKRNDVPMPTLQPEKVCLAQEVHHY
jgi:hypothetical protein